MVVTRNNQAKETSEEGHSSGSGGTAITGETLTSENTNKTATTMNTDATTGTGTTSDTGATSATGTTSDTRATTNSEAGPSTSNAGGPADTSGIKATPAASTATVIERRTIELMPPPTKTKTPKPARSHRSKASSKRLLAELEAKERLAELELKRIHAETELAKIRQERMNIESSPEESEEEEDLAPQRIADWFERRPEPETAIEIPTHEERRENVACATNLRKRREQYEEAPPRPAHTVDVSSLTVALTEAIQASKSNKKFLSDLPVFSGLCNEWLQFKAAYIESSSSFSRSENVARIRRSLKGVAWEAVSALLISQPHPDDVIAALERRYGRPDALLISETEKMKGLPRLSDSPRDLCIFASKIANTVATIEILKKPQYLYNPEVLRTIVDKLTPILRNKWYDYAATREDTPELKKIAEFLNNEADKCAPYAPPENPAENREARVVKKKPERSYALTSEGEKKSEDKQACPLCKPANHQLPSCPQFKKIDTNERWEVAKKHNICYRCLASTHRRFACRAKPCGQHGCPMKHHRLLHHERTLPPAAATQERSPTSKTEEVVASAVEQIAGAATKASRAYLKIAPVILRGPKAEIDAFALLDEGSTVTIIDAALADTLGLDGPTEPMWVQGVSGKEMAHKNSKKVDVYIRGRHSDSEQRIRNAHTVSSLDFTTQSVGEKEIEDCTHLEEIKNELTYHNATPKILIGQDQWELIVSRAIRRGRRDQLVASKTLLGWVLHGCRTSRAEPIAYCCAHLTQTKPADKLEEMMKQYFALESLSIEPRKQKSDPELQALRILEEKSRRLPDGSVKVALAAAKSRVTPTKPISVPRLELQAAVLGVRLAKTVAEEHEFPIATKTYWSDSRTALAWIRAEPRTYKTFVAHRLAEIEDVTKKNEWRWVPSAHNAADDATRATPENFDASHRWFRGPPFLYLPEAAWPVENRVEIPVTGEEKEKCGATNHQPNEKHRAVPIFERFSKWTRLLRTAARVLQFVDLCRRTPDTPTQPDAQLIAAARRKRTRANEERDGTWSRCTQRANTPAKRITKKPEERKYITLEAKYLLAAEQLLVRTAQEESYAQERERISNSRAPDKDDRLAKLSVYIDKDQVIRLRGRIAAAGDLQEEAVRPAVLHGKHYYTKLYISHIHEKLHHGGTEIVVNELRQRVHIVKIRPAVKEVIARCPKCRLHKAKPAAPSTGDLPAARLAHHVRPFTYTGWDYYGPQEVTVGRHREKRYVALFTCMTSRAVHLEVAASLSTDSAINALRRFIARRGCPTELWSDNATAFRGADRELTEAVKEAANARHINWRFLPPAAPFMAGAWERMVRTVKEAMKATLHEKYPSDETLQTLLAEAEATVNSRPLTYVAVTPDDPPALTPNMILLGPDCYSPAPGTFSDSDANARQHWRRAQQLADTFWKRWVREYTPLLQQRREPYNTGVSPAVGDVVIICDSNLPRNTWPRGRVTKVYPGKDGVVRVVDVTTSRGHTLRRPTKKIVVLPVGS